MTTVVVSIDGVAPRYITPTTMPGLLALARLAGACFRARTVQPSITLPAHISMLRGVGPALHGVTDNQQDAELPTDVAPSFLGLCRQNGRTTAAVTSWSPLQSAIGSDAATYNLAFDDGYNPAVDSVVTSAAVTLLSQSQCPDVMFVYLIGPDLAGHDHGWGSTAYQSALTTADRYLDQIVAALEPGGHTMIVTTDHGGSQYQHASTAIDDMETFIVARSPSLDAGSTWEQASILDIAPTVADCCGLAPDPRWEGRSLLGRSTPILDHLVELVGRQAHFTYGERVNMAEHALQTAARAQSAGASDDLVVAAVLHDVGHLFGDAGEWGLPDHAEAGARALQGLLPPCVTEPIRLHVEAKRWLVANDAGYADQLSEASTISLNQQGGPLNVTESHLFAAQPFADDAIALRKWDDDGKMPDIAAPDIQSFTSAITAVLTSPTPDPRWVRDACRCDECRDPISDQHLMDGKELERWQSAVVKVQSAEPKPQQSTEYGDSGHSVAVMLTTADGSETHRCMVPAQHWPASLSASREQENQTSRSDSRVSWNRRSIDAVVRTPVLFGNVGWDDDLCHRLAVDGLALVSGVPTEPGTVGEVARSLGFVRTTNYGSLFDVRYEPEPENLAYSTAGLPLHTDNPYRRPCPTVQLLHCLRPAETGGDTVLVDGLRAAEILAAELPDMFATLSSVPVLFRFHSKPKGAASTAVADDVDLQAVRTVIEVAADGSVTAVNVNHRSMEVPEPTLAPEFYSSYLRFCSLLNDEALAIGLKLQAGDLIAFDNRRILHARTEFTAATGRHLQGCYIDIDAVHSRARTTNRG